MRQKNRPKRGFNYNKYEKGNQVMGLMLTTTSHMEMLENEVESYKIGLANMSKAHDRLLKQYRELRDSKDAEILKLHREIEALKVQAFQDAREKKRLRQCVTYYEEKKNGTADADTLPVG